MRTPPRLFFASPELVAARAIRAMSGDELLVDHGSLYPALQRLENMGWLAAAWGASSNNRKARFYKLPPAGWKQLTPETKQWERIAAGVGRVLTAVKTTG